MFCCPDNGIINVGVKVEDPEDGHEETHIDHDGQELTSKERYDCTIARWHMSQYLVCSRSLLLSIDRQGPSARPMGNLPGVDGNQATVQVRPEPNLSDPVPVEDAVTTNWCSVCSSPTLGV